jgi:dienelactone hydrolase
MFRRLDLTRRALARLVVMCLMATAAAVAIAPAAEAQSNPYERGPNPTASLLEASRGSYSTSTTRVSSLVSGFGGGTIYYPTTTSDGTFGGVVISPGYTGSQSSISWLGPRLASHGFVVFTIDTNSRYDQPSSRATQLQNAADYLTGRSSERSRIDSNRIALMGHSMGGGGSLIAADRNPSISAIVPLTPWTVSNNFSSLRVPTLIIGAANDSVAPVRSHASPQYNSIPSSVSKMYLELRGASHFAPNTSNTTIGRYSLAWLKRFVDNDTRYTPFLCGQPHRDYVSRLLGPVSEDRDTCPF